MAAVYEYEVKLIYYIFFRFVIYGLNKTNTCCSYGAVKETLASDNRRSF